MPDLLCLQKWVLHMSNRSSTFWKHSFTAHVTLLTESMCSIPHSCPTSCLLLQSTQEAGLLPACHCYRIPRHALCLRPLHAGRNKLHTVRIALKPGERCFQLSSFFHLSNERMCSHYGLGEGAIH